MPLLAPTTASGFETRSVDRAERHSATPATSHLGLGIIVVGHGTTTGTPSTTASAGLLAVTSDAQDARIRITP